MTSTPQLPHWYPEGRTLELPGRGATWVHELGGPGAAPASRFRVAAAPEPPTVFLLHGWTATASLNWFPTFGPLSRHARVVAPDHRGHGKGLRTTKRFRLEDCADDVVAIADELGIDRFIAAGYSMGGPIAQLIWQRHPDRLAGLVLCATASSFRGRPGENVLFGVMGGLSVAARLTPERWRQQLSGRLIDERVDDSPSGQWAGETMRTHDSRMIVEAGLAIGRFDSRPWIGGVDVPTAVLVTEFDGVVPSGRQRQLARRIPGADTFDIRGDHDVCVSRPEAFVPTLVEAVTSVAARAGRRDSLIA